MIRYNSSFISYFITKSKKIEDEFYSIASMLGILELHEAEVKAAYQMMKDLSKVDDADSSQSGRLQRNIGLEELGSICPECICKGIQEVEYEDYEGLPITIEREEQLKQRCKQHALALQTDRKTFQTMMIINFVSELLRYVPLSTTTKTVNSSNSPFQPRFDVECMQQSKQAFHQLLEIHYILSHVNETHKKEYQLNELNYYENAIIFGRAKNMDRIRSHLSLSEVSLSPPLTLMPNAYYRRSKNRVYVNAELLQPPFYLDGDDKLSNYGRIGFLISHELFHSIDIAGVWYDENGNIQKSGFFAALSYTISAKTGCFQEQYGREETTRHKTRRADFLDEIIADNGALDMSFMTYKKLLRKLAGHVIQDPDITLKHDQSFFHHFAQTFCGHLRGEALKEYTNNFPYPLNKDRVNIPLSNSEEFAKAYQCPLDSPMNPPKRCKVY
ncbi:Neprilysin-4 [Schistosoma japonicum]|uniref:Neprilysin-4 n=1 Tax=Schistosoma japonicum TaxID=6182 RepID=A0A4Z2DQU1_SCHJA|nr:Neprilysin-4 [Schistosoma japonicum]